jgi:diguanylate cyclase (GGDEF)-like protein
MPKLYVIAEKKDEIKKELFSELKGVEVIYGDSIPFRELFDADIIVGYISNEQWGIEEIPEIRSQPELFLKPLYELSERRIEKLAGIVDDTILFSSSPSAVAQKIQKGLNIAKKVSAYHQSFPIDNVQEILLLRFMESRENYRLTPLMDHCARLGYTYPLVTALLNDTEADELDLVDELAEAFLLSRTLLDKINLCPFCGYVQVNVREICPKCQSLNIQEEPINRDFGCSDCGNHFPSPAVDCLCFRCGKQFTMETALNKKIYEYAISSDGIRAAKEGNLPTASLMKVIRKETGYYAFDIFKEMYQQEVKRCFRYKYTSTLIRFDIKNVKQIIDQLGINQAQKVWKDIATVFNDNLRDTDILTDYRVNENLVILPNTNLDGAKAMIERMKSQIDILVKQTLDLQYKVIELQDEKIELEALLSKMK